MSAQPSTTQVFSKVDARRARISYQHLAQIVNLIVNRIIQTADEKAAETFTPSVFQTIHAFHGVFNGREVSKDKPLFRAHIFTAPHFGFRDRRAELIDGVMADDALTPEEKQERIADIRARTEDSAGRLVCRRLNDLEEAEAAGGRRLFIIRRADGVTQKLTSYEGHPLLDAAEALYLKIRNAPDYKKNPSAAVTEALLDEAVASLPEIDKAAKVGGNGERAPMAADDLMNDAVLKGMWTKIINSAERALIGEFEAGSDPELAAKRYAAKIVNMGQDIKRRLARERLRAVSSLGEEDLTSALAGEEDDGGGKNSVGQLEGGNAAAPEENEEEVIEIWGDNYVTPPESQETEPQEVTGAPFSETVNLALHYALDFARQGVAVLPLWGVSEGVCNCKYGSACRTPGKHPHSTLARKQTAEGLLKGVYSATTDGRVIRSWFEKDARINYGLAMGGELNLICVDIDPRNDGDATYYDLIEAYGEAAFPETFTTKTGGAGWHKLYRSSEAISHTKGELKGKLGPGVDIKGSGGLIVGPGSMHASGRRYEVEINTFIAEAPERLLDALKKAAAGEAPETVIDFQAHRDRKRSGVSGSVIVEGERNERLFKVGCALWGKGEVPGRSELFSRLLDVNAERVSPPLVPSEVAKIADGIAGRYQRGVAIQGGAA